MTDNSSFATNEPVDMTESNNGLSDTEERQRQAEIYDRLLDGRSFAESVVLEAPQGEIECDIAISDLDRKTRWDVLKSLPDGMFEAADEEGDIDESDISISASTIPGGDGVEMLELVLKETLTAKHLSDGQLKSVIDNDLSDQLVIELGMKILEMSFETGQVSGFRLK